VLTITPTRQACGASVSGIDLSASLSADLIAEIRRAWLVHHVLVFPHQSLTDDDLVRFTNCFGSVGDDPFFVPMESNDQVVALTRRANETAPVFAEAWHTDWSFRDAPPIGTCLYSLTIPPVGGDTGFINQHHALAKMPQQLRARLQNKLALHSAAVAYAPDGMYGKRDADSDRSMKIITNETAREVRTHPFIVAHPESGQETLFGTYGYIVGVEDMAHEDAQALIEELYEWQTREEFQYTHKWQEDMLVIWDNRSVLHKANGGYDGHARELHRTTIAGKSGLAID
jgi:taurine dioxygenase